MRYYRGMIELTRVVEMLNARRGECKRLSSRLGIPYNTLLKIAKGETANPTMATLNKLQPLLRRRK